MRPEVPQAIPATIANDPLLPFGPDGFPKALTLGTWGTSKLGEAGSKGQGVGWSSHAGPGGNRRTTRKRTAVPA